MANIERRPNGGWRARYYDHAAKQHVKHSPRKIDAKAWIDALTASVLSEASTVVCTSGLSCTAIIDIRLWRPDRMPLAPRGWRPHPLDQSLRSDVGYSASRRGRLTCRQEFSLSHALSMHRAAPARG